MRTPAKIELGIKCCASANVDKCIGCPYAGLHLGIGCKTILFRDVQDYLKEIRKSAARIEAMTKQLEAAQPKWNSVFDMEPEFNVDVLVYDEDGNTHVAQLLEDGNYWRPDIVYGYLSRLDVTHWMPLPEPPKEEEQ